MSSALTGREKAVLLGAPPILGLLAALAAYVGGRILDELGPRKPS